MNNLNFRAWVPSEKKMADVINIHLRSRRALLPIETPSRDGFYWINSEWGFDDIILMQSTGLKDRNGTMIYEGDIVQMKWTIYDEPEFFYIRAIEGRAPRVDNCIKGKELWLVHQDCKVVGDIYRYPNMLERYDKEV